MNLIRFRLGNLCHSRNWRYTVGYFAILYIFEIVTHSKSVFFEHLPVTRQKLYLHGFILLSQKTLL